MNKIPDIKLVNLDAITYAYGPENEIRYNTWKPIL
jgi:hypothetical protein